jgi:hypothetical protein
MTPGSLFGLSYYVAIIGLHLLFDHYLPQKVGHLPAMTKIFSKKKKGGGFLVASVVLHLIAKASEKVAVE